MLYTDAMRSYIRDRMASKAGGTVRNDRQALAGLARSLPAGIDVADVTIDHLDDWLAAMAGLAPGTKLHRIAGVASFFKWCVRRELRPDDPTLWIQRPRPKRAVPRALNAGQVAAAFEACQDVREELILSLLVMEGLRVGEVARLEVDDVDLEERMLLVTGKGGHERVVPLTEATEAVLRRYWREHPPQGVRPLVRQYVPFRGASTPRPLTPQSVSRMMSRLCWAAGIKSADRDGVSGHAFRHTMLSDVYRQTRNLRLVQELAGHASLTTTQVYLRHASPEEMRAAVGGRSYR